ncbi:hypothetical protein [Winogradskyella bathintestinalis]|uniref:AlgX/AlgJ SGNH hydrolase-like domain-containing protein n=1 Tax=Winogradskyella bathintestinalis TaxID=3035208 RepID=A0ABT7ZTY0_9FLAO|nr:hypothetical protein [Winogradskyella bathintestinalis]MDN3492427.1 hypothetical protein [Winogradskyella bathintestinalis]
MNRFFIKCILFLLPIIGLLSCDIFSPIDAFTHRPWEALLFGSNKSMYYYPNQNLTKQSVGDLCHHTEFAIKKNEKWITDKLGYRNNTFIKSPEVLIIGDSFIVGSSITQDSTITNVLANEFNRKVYNIAPANFEDFIDLLNSGVIEKPKIVIYALNEKGVPSPIKMANKKRVIKDVSSFSVFKDKVKRLYSLKYLKSRLFGKHGQGVPGMLDSSMFFLNGKEQKYPYDQVINVASTIQSYKAYSESIDIDFIFLPLPIKETVYYDKIPLHTQPDYLLQLDSILHREKVKTINTLELFNNYRNSNSDLIYHLDDTHWNARGVELVTEKIVKIVQINKQ